jgi:hypothetical protein
MNLQGLTEENLPVEFNLRLYYVVVSGDAATWTPAGQIPEWASGRRPEYR